MSLEKLQFLRLKKAVFLACPTLNLDRDYTKFKTMLISDLRAVISDGDFERGPKLQDKYLAWYTTIDALQSFTQARPASTTSDGSGNNDFINSNLYATELTVADNVFISVQHLYYHSEGDKEKIRPTQKKETSDKKKTNPIDTAFQGQVELHNMYIVIRYYLPKSYSKESSNTLNRKHQDVIELFNKTYELIKTKKKLKKDNQSGEESNKYSRRKYTYNKIPFQPIGLRWENNKHIFNRGS
jgi:hypothetical protein